MGRPHVVTYCDRCKRQVEYDRARAERRRKTRIRLRICTVCLTPAKAGKKMCERHLQYYRQRRAEQK